MVNRNHLSEDSSARGTKLLNEEGWSRQGPENEADERLEMNRLFCLSLSTSPLFAFSLAPDYILCSKTTENRLVPEIVKAWQLFYTDNPINSDSYCHIVNQRHFERVQKLIDADKVVHGGQTEARSNYIAPTIMYAERNTLPSESFSLILGPMFKQPTKSCKRKSSGLFCRSSVWLTSKKRSNLSTIGRSHWLSTSSLRIETLPKQLSMRQARVRRAWTMSSFKSPLRVYPSVVSVTVGWAIIMGNIPSRRSAIHVL